MIFIVEGPDLTGKTTLAHAIAHELQVRGYGYPGIYHAGPPEGDPVLEYEPMIYDHDPIASPPIVFDRWHVGERVWPTIFSRNTTYSDAAAYHTELLLRSRGGIVINCRRADRLEHGEALVAAGEPINADGLYRAILSYARFDVEVAAAERLTVVPFDDFVSHAQEAINTALRLSLPVLAAHAASNAKWIGHACPDVLFVDGRPSLLDEAPMTPWVDTPARMFMSMLKTERRCRPGFRPAIVETRSTGGLSPLWRAIGHPAIVALGIEAVDALRRSGFDSSQFQLLPHPEDVYGQLARMANFSSRLRALMEDLA